MNDNNTIEKRLQIEKAEPLLLFGFNDIYLKRIERAFPNVQITARGDQVHLSGEPSEVNTIERVLNEMTALLNRNGNLTENDVDTVLALFTHNSGSAASLPLKGSHHTVLFTPSGGSVKAKTKKKVLV